MPQSNSSTQVSIAKLILIPSVITLAITILRLVGELQHWSPAFFRSSAGGAGAIVGIAWLPIIFGPYFAVKLASEGKGPGSPGKSVGFAVIGFVVFGLGLFLLFNQKLQFPGKPWVATVFALTGAGVQFVPWSAFAKTLLAYSYAARIPVAILMLLAIQGNWGTHYDVLPPGYNGPTDFWGKYFMIAFFPQLLGWVAYTIVIGSLFGTVVAAIARRGQPASARPA